MTKRKDAPRTVKGKDIELYASDGQAVNTSRQAPFTNPPAKPKDGTLGAILARTPFGRAAKVLRGE